MTVIYFLNEETKLKSIILHQIMDRSTKENSGMSLISPQRGSLKRSVLWLKAKYLVIFYFLVPSFKNFEIKDFPGRPVIKNPPVNSGDTGSTLGLGRSHMPQSN